jgi:hypothetical protein
MVRSRRAARATPQVLRAEGKIRCRAAHAGKRVSLVRKHVSGRTDHAGRGF